MGPYELLQRVITAFEELNIRYIVTGSVASMAYGEPRLTNDIDIVADIKLEQIAFLERYFPHDEFYFDRNMVVNAINQKSQFNIIHPASGLKVDIFLYKIPSLIALDSPDLEKSNQQKNIELISQLQKM